jgi:hypothetical protein
MPINTKCNKCGEELKTFGGLLFSPPDSQMDVKKYHLCGDCYRQIEEELKN